VGDSVIITLNAGDILYDVITHDWAVLIARKKQWTYRYSIEEEPYTIWVWEMFWTPVPDASRYTEESLLRMIEEERLVLYKNGN
tara:strand:- start:1129 stop:1380 length:252 start_codon:yes stop_codon:yes gene_type:complete